MLFIILNYILADKLRIYLETGRKYNSNNRESEQSDNSTYPCESDQSFHELVTSRQVVVIQKTGMS